MRRQVNPHEARLTARNGRDGNSFRAASQVPVRKHLADCGDLSVRRAVVVRGIVASNRVKTSLSRAFYCPRRILFRTSRASDRGELPAGPERTGSFGIVRAKPHSLLPKGMQPADSTFSIL